MGQFQSEAGQTEQHALRLFGNWDRVWLGGTLALALALGGCHKPQQIDPFAGPAQVEVAPVTQADVPITREWIGSIDGSNNAEIRSRVSGYIISQNYKDGAVVKKGAVLFEIDPRPFEASLAQAQADLAQAQAEQVRAQLNADKYTSLYAAKAVSQQDRDNAVQQNEAAKAKIKAQQANVEQAQLNLEFTKVTAPLDGVASIATRNLGDLVGPSDAQALATLSTVDPVRAYFQISEQAYMKIADRVSAAGDKDHPGPPIEIVLADGTTYPRKGRFVAIDRQVDTGTGTIRLAAEFANPGNILRPGQFVRVRVVVKTEIGALVVPQQALQELQGSYQVAVIGDDNKASIRIVKPGPRFGAMWVIEDGLKLGEKIVVEGVQKATNGKSVTATPFKPVASAESVPSEPVAKSAGSLSEGKPGGSPAAAAQ